MSTGSFAANDTEYPNPEPGVPSITWGGLDQLFTLSNTYTFDMMFAPTTIRSASQSMLIETPKPFESVPTPHVSSVTVFHTLAPAS